MEQKNSSVSILSSIDPDVFKIDGDMTPEEKNDALTAAALARIATSTISAADAYKLQRESGDINLVDVVREKLLNAGMPNSDAYDNNRHIKDAQELAPHAQQFHLNRYFAEEFNRVQAERGVDTRTSRFCLIYEITPTEWMNVVEKQTIPNLVSSGAYSDEQPEAS